MKMYSTGEFTLSALVLPLPAADPLLAPFRRRYTSDGALGMPAHITLLYPFVSCLEWNPDFESRLRELTLGMAPLTVTLTRLGRFDRERVMYLEPVPRPAILEIIHAVTEAFPQYPPFSGRVLRDDLHPHATLAILGSDHRMEEVTGEIRRDVLPGLPVSEQVSGIWMVVRTLDGWERYEVFPFGG